MIKNSLRPRMSEQAWPVEGLEQVPNCPICSSVGRHLLHEDLVDKIFFAARGKWSMWQCADCRSAYLDPRPNEATIGLAYSHYYTHDEAPAPPTLSGLQRLRAGLGNDYRNRRYGSHLSPVLPLGRWIAAAIPPLRWPVDVGYRYLSRPRKGGSKQVLDIGCGNGNWLEVAREAGWQVAGVDPDPISGQLARERGIEVRQSIADWLETANSFDFITMSHVIEHVHDPLQLLRNSFTLLRPGGGLFIDTPNIDALGHRLYGRDWRGLEPPRHLTIFNRASLSDAVAQAGFRHIRYRRRFPFADLSARSRRMAAGLDPYSADCSPEMPPPPGRLRHVQAALARKKSEFLTLTAIKPR